MAKLNLFRAAILSVALVGAASCYMAPSAGDEEMTMPAAEEPAAEEPAAVEPAAEEPAAEEPAAEEGIMLEDSMESGHDMDEMDADDDMETEEE
ncbi:MAG: hypothetical protein IH971_07670 [Candidatus Marinimicrobia bacterium]|nr:hypothetical protein [Candidatus Neomarinimicrobiota bacterium]